MLRNEVQPLAFAVLAALSLVATLPGCNAASPPPAASAPTTPAPLPAGVIGSAIGQSLEDADREKAIVAQDEAVNSGTRKSWRGAHGAYGFVLPGPESGSCRDYTHKIFINGRPQEAKGQACRGPDGAWRVSS